MATGNRHVIEAVGRHPATGAVCQCVAMALTDSGLLIEMVNDDGQRILVHRYTWNAVKQAVDQLLVTRQAEAVAEAAQYDKDD